jgi:hypothetical protein
MLAYRDKKKLSVSFVRFRAPLQSTQPMIVYAGTILIRTRTLIDLLSSTSVKLKLVRSKSISITKAIAG